MHPTAARLAQRLEQRGLQIEVRTLTDSARTAALAAAGTPHDVFGIETEELIRALPDAHVVDVS